MAATNGQFFTEQFLKPNGQPASGVRVFHYEAGNTTSNLDVYQNGNLSSPHSNPVVGDAAGRVSFYGNGTYRLLVMTAFDDATHPNTILYDWDPVELVHHTATLRAEDQGLSLPAASSSARGRQFATTDAGGDITALYYQRSAAAWQQFLTPSLNQMLEFAKGTTIASSSSVTIPADGNFFDVSGANAIETMSGFTGYPIIFLRTLSPLIFTHHATNLIMLGAQSRLTLANQVTAFLQIGPGQWMELWYTNPFLGDGTFTQGAVLVGNVQSQFTDVALPTAGRVLGHIGTAATDPSWITGLLTHGPTAVGAGSSLAHEGNVTITGNTSLSGVHCYTNFTLNNGVTITVPAGSKRLIILASDTITINGSIIAQGAGATSGVGINGNSGTDQPGGSAGNNSQAGGESVINGIVMPGNITGNNLSIAFCPLLAMGGGGGGGGAEETGGTGGGSLVFIAPRVAWGAGSFMNTAGTDASAAPFQTVAGGGGGAGNIYVITRTFVNGGVSLNQSGGAGGGGSIANGQAGAAGVMQVLIYG